jgi:truncated hemoglobin YjbI
MTLYKYIDGFINENFLSCVMPEEKRDPHKILEKNNQTFKGAVEKHVDYLHRAHHHAVKTVHKAAQKDGFEGSIDDLTQEHFQKYAAVGGEAAVNHILSKLYTEIGKDGPLNINPDRKSWLDEHIFKSYFGKSREELAGIYGNLVGTMQGTHRFNAGALDQIVKDEKITQKIAANHENLRYKDLTDEDASAILAKYDPEGLLKHGEVKNIKTAVSIGESLQQDPSRVLLELGSKTQTYRWLTDKAQGIYDQIINSGKDMADPNKYKEVTGSK